MRPSLCRWCSPRCRPVGRPEISGSGRVPGRLPILIRQPGLCCSPPMARLGFSRPSSIAPAMRTFRLTARRILFAGQTAAGGDWNIYEMDLQSLTTRQVTRNAGNCRSPIYTSSFYTITEKEPWEQIAFVSTLARQADERGTGPATSLYTCKLDGSFLQRITYNLSSDLDPAIMADGRLVYAAWRRATFDDGVRGRLVVEGINTDGSDRAPLVPQLGGQFQRMPCVTAGGLLVFVEADPAAGDGAGRLVLRLAAQAVAYVPVDHRAAGWTVLLSLTSAGWPDPGLVAARGWVCLLRALSPGSGDRAPRAGVRRPELPRDPGQGRARSAAARRPIQRGLGRGPSGEALLHERLSHRIQGSRLAGSPDR